MKKFKVAAIALTIAVALTGCGGAKKGPGTAKDGNEVAIEKASIALVQKVEAGKYNLVSTEELKKWIDDKEDMLIVDTMPAKNFEKNRIPGAVNAELPVKMEDVTPEQREAFVNALGTEKDKKVVIYCGFVGCERSDVGALIAIEEGFTNVYRQPGGIIAWMDAGYPVEK